MKQSDTQLAHKTFLLADGLLFRRQICGGLRPVRTLEHENVPEGKLKGLITCNTGRVLVVVGGRKMYGPQIAWALLYGSWPMYPIIVADGDPHNLREENLLAIRTRRLRPRIVAAGTRIVHNLSQVGFATPEEARDDWRRCAAEHYAKDMPHVLTIEAEARRRAPPLGNIEVPAARVVKVQANKPTTRPKKVEGRKWHWYEGEWLSVPEPCHVSDDYMLRCAAVKKGAKAFVYDEEQGRTVAVY